MAPLSGAFAQSGGNRRCRFIVHIADLSALVLIHELPECTTSIPINKFSSLQYTSSRRSEQKYWFYGRYCSNSADTRTVLKGGVQAPWGIEWETE